jgi:Lrp/AsnC family transcriptional regulator, regulator for asnA, asnC and gidA
MLRWAAFMRPVQEMMQLSLDALDHQLIDQLRRDGRLANTEIARRLGVSETTVRNRIQRLVGEGVLQVAAILNLSRLGYEVDVIVGIHCAPSRAEEVAAELGAMPEVRYLAYVTGRYDLLLAAFFQSREELFEFLVERLGKIPGIARTETLNVLRLARRDYDFWEARMAGTGWSGPV